MPKPTNHLKVERFTVARVADTNEWLPEVERSRWGNESDPHGRDQMSSTHRNPFSYKMNLPEFIRHARRPPESRRTRRTVQMDKNTTGKIKRDTGRPRCRYGRFESAGRPQSPREWPPQRFYPTGDNLTVWKLQARTGRFIRDFF